MPDQLMMSGWQQFLLLLAGPLVIGGLVFMWQVSRVANGARKPHRKRKRKRF
jgi:hypothetical protein